jgi:ATP-dependent Lon protease
MSKEGAPIGVKASVLVVDDDTLVRSYLDRVLVHDGFEVVAVESGEAALTLVEQREFDVALVDLKMEGISGMKVLEAVRQQWPDTIVIMLTGHPTLDTVFEALKQGAHDYLFKPCRIGELRKSLSKGLLHRQQLLQQREEKQSPQNL